MELEKEKKLFRGRGALLNPTDRFSRAIEERDPEFTDNKKTEVRFEEVKSALSKNDSPDISFTYSINPYRGCEHGCVYCYARPTHEYLGMSLGLDFETKLIAKKNIAELLAKEMSRKSYVPQTIALSGATDPYQPIERNLKLTRQCLEVLERFRNPVAIITKNSLLERDIDLLLRLKESDAVLVAVSITTLDPALALRMEPRAAHPEARVRLVETLAKAGVPVGVMMAPLIPGLTDEAIPTLLKTVSSAGAQFASYVMLRLPYRVDQLFEEWLQNHYPERKERVLGLVRQVRGGALKDSRFGIRMKGEGKYAEQISALFSVYRRKFQLDGPKRELSTRDFKVPDLGPQLNLFD